MTWVPKPDGSFVHDSLPYLITSDGLLRTTKESYGGIPLAELWANPVAPVPSLAGQISAETDVSGTYAVDAVTTPPTPATVVDEYNVTYRILGDAAVGRLLLFNFLYYAVSAVGAAAGAGVYLFPCPDAAYQFDIGNGAYTTSIPGAGAIVGGGRAHHFSVEVANLQPCVYDANNLMCCVESYTGANRVLESGSYNYGVNGILINFSGLAPIIPL